MLMNVSHTSYELLTKFSSSYKLLKIFFQTPNHFIMNFLGIFLQISSKNLQTSYKRQTSYLQFDRFLQKSFKLCTKILLQFIQTSNKFRMNFLRPSNLGYTILILIGVSYRKRHRDF